MMALTLVTAVVLEAETVLVVLTVAVGLADLVIGLAVTVGLADLAVLAVDLAILADLAVLAGVLALILVTFELVLVDLGSTLALILWTLAGLLTSLLL